MKIKIKRKTLRDYLNVAASINSGSLIPVLAFLKVVARKQKATFTFTNLDVTFIEDLECEIEEEGECLVNCSDLTKIVKATKSKFLELSLLNNHSIKLLTDVTEFILQSREVREVSEFPESNKVPFANKINLNFADFTKGIKHTLPFITKEQSRFILSCLQLQFKGSEMQMAGTDRHRLGFFSKKQPETLESTAITLLMSVEGMKIIQKVKPSENSQMQLSWSEFEICFQVDNKTFICRIPSGNFPNIDCVMLKDRNYVFTLPRLELLQILRELAVATKSNDRIVIARDEEGKTTISCQTEEIATSALINSTMILFRDSKEIKIPIQSRYLVEGIRLLTTEEVQFALLRDNNGGFGQIEITGVTENDVSDEVFKYVVMPLKK